MKNFAKLLSVVLAIALCLSSVSFAAFTDEAEIGSYSEATTILNALGIITGYEDGSFGPNKTITRAEFAAVVCRALGLGESLGGAQVFTDVPANHWAAGYVALAYQQNIINGYGDGNFGPSDNVKYKDAIKMVVAALGYNPVAEVNGGYPGGYQVVASSAGLLAGITGASADEPATRAVVAQMVYNGLTVPMMKQTGFGTNTSYGYSNEMLLNKIGVTKFYGTVDATSLSDYETIKEGKVRLAIDKQFTAIEDQSSVAILTPGTTNYEKSANPYLELGSKGLFTVNVKDEAVNDASKELLDYAAVLYVKGADSDEPELVAIAKRGNRNQEVSFAAEDIYDTKTTSSEVAVFTDKENDKYDKYKVDIEKLYVNNVEFVEYVDDKGNDDANDDVTVTAADKFATYAKSSVAGDIRLLNNTADGDAYSVAYVTTYVDMVISDIRAADYKLYSDNAGTLILDEEESDYNFTIYKDGEKVAFDAIQVNDVVSYSGVKNSSNELESGIVIVTSNQVSGVIETYGDKSAKDYTVTINGETYKYNNNELTIGSDVTDAADIGDQVTFYINARGVICGIDAEETNTNLQYGFATLMAKGQGLNSGYDIRICDATGAWDTYSMNTRVSVNGNGAEAATSANWASYTGKSLTDGKYIINDVVAYETNADGKITKIYFQEDVKGKFDITDKTDAEGDGTATYYSDVNTFGGVTLGEKTVVYSVAADADLTAEIEEDVVTVSTRDGLVNRQTYGYGFTAYNVNKDNVAAVVYGKGLVGAIDYASAFFTISKVTTKNNAEGESGKEITGIVNGEQTTLFVPSTATVKKLTYAGSLATTTTDINIDDLKKGTVIIYSKDAKGEAKEVVILADIADLYTDGVIVDTMLGETETFEAGGDEFTFMFGYVADKSSTSYYAYDELGYKNGALIADPALSISGVNGTVVDPYTGTNGKVVSAAAGDINYAEKEEGTNYKGDIIFVRVVNDIIVKDFVAFRGDDQK